MSGYVTDTTYADTFFRELSPAWLNYVAALNGVAPRRLEQRFTYLELGCGFGTSAVLNAASYPAGSFHACDLNDAHIASGRAYAARLAVHNIELHTRTFSAMLDADLPAFDFIVLHGVYSWVDAPTRAVIDELLGARLVKGGLVYISYNALPGWAHELPLRKLLVELAQTAAGTAADRAESAAGLMRRVSEAGWRYFTANPGATAAVDAYARGEGAYLAHEFMNAAWEPFYGVDVADALAGVGLRPVGSATLADNHLALVADAKAAEAIASLPSERQQRLALDFAANRRFRRDVFVRADGSPPDARHLDDTLIGCVRDLDDIDVVMRIPRGEMRFQESFIRDVRALMAGGTCTVAHAVSALARGGHDRGGITRNLLYLVAGGMLAPCARDSRVPGTAPTRIATPVVERALAGAATADRNTVLVPSDVYGNAVEMSQQEARALSEWSPRQSGSSAKDVERRLATYARLGLVV